jgi:type I restriction enzyme S subunit
MSWEMVKLSNVAEVIAGQSPESKYYNDKGEGIPFFQGKADFRLDYPVVRYWCTQPTKIAKPFDILMSVRAPVGPTNICNIEACIGRGLAAIRTTDKLDYKYLYFYFKTIETKLASQGNGSTFSAITTSVLKDLLIPLPPLATQKRIAEILDAADALKRKDQQLLKKYDELAQAIFIDMFGDPVKNEKGWEVKNLGEFGKISTGNTPSRAESKNYDTNYIEWVKTDNIEEQCLYVSKASEYLSEIGFQKGRVANRGSLLIACIAGSIDSIGRAALTDRDVSFNQQINTIEPNGNVNSFFLYYLFRYCRKHIQNHASNGMKRMLSKGQFEKIKMILPNLEIQNEFDEKINQLMIQNDKMKSSFVRSKNLFQTLIQKAFNGELVN